MPHQVKWLGSKNLFMSAARGRYGIENTVGMLIYHFVDAASPAAFALRRPSALDFAQILRAFSIASGRGTNNKR